jgi:hypothetical protein
MWQSRNHKWLREDGKMIPKSRIYGYARVALTVLAVVSVAAIVQAQDPVEVSVDVSGIAEPGGSVQATANVTINDGSTVQSTSWMQVGGAEVTLSGTSGQTITVTFPSEQAYKDYLIHVLMEPPITEEQLPPNVPLPEGEFPAGLQNRFQVVGVNPFALEHTAATVLEVTVTTSSGTYHGEGDIVAAVPWKVSTGLLNVPVGVPVLLHGKDQDTYDWTLSAPGGSGAVLIDDSSQNPQFVPDVSGHYSIMVTDNETDEMITMPVYAGTWLGVIVDQDEEGRPIADSSCTGCHNDKVAEDTFTPWAQTGHAEIFSSQLDTSTHYGEGCFACHTVGFDHTADNDGVDEATDYQAFLDSGLINNPGDNWTAVLQEYPHTARLANIQCENCHGPQVGGAHLPDDPEGEPRVSLSANVCATCHGEPLRHARFQQWQLSPHANYELAIDEGSSGSCSRCHTGNGFLAWLPVLTGEEPGDPLDDVEVTWTEDETHPQTCQTCHDPHAIGTTTGTGTNATVRISGDTPPLIAGFTATDVGRGAICMTCHNSRRGLRNDDTFNQYYGTSEAARAPHGGVQTDVLMGQNAYLVEVGQRANHSLTSNVQDTCVTCHMEETPPPPDLAYNLGGTNHTFYASADICQNCHTNLTADTIQGPVEEQLIQLQDMIENALYNLIDELTEAGNTIDVNGDATITDAGQIAEIEFGESHGRQAMALELTDGTSIGLTRMSDIDVVPPMGEALDLYRHANPFLIKAGWNYNLLHSDGSLGVHNPLFTFEILDRSTAALASGLEPCAPDADTMCLQGGRFKVEVTWRDQDGNTGSGMVTECGSDDSGIFYFFREDNWEMLFKVLNGCSVNDHYWVFFAATTNVEFTTRVTDTLTGFVKTYGKSGEEIEYNNPLGQPANAVTDTTAFATCP